MSVILFSIIAAATVATVGGAFAARRIVQRRKARSVPALPAAAEDDSPEPAASLDGPTLKVGDVIQHEMATRWPQGALAGSDHKGLQLMILLSQEAGIEQATVAFAPPDRSLLWLQASEQLMPHQPPARIEIDGVLLDRKRLLPLTLKAQGDAPAELSGDAMVAIYEGVVGDAALLLDHPNKIRLWHGTKLAEDDYERLANVPDKPS